MPCPTCGAELRTDENSLACADRWHADLSERSGCHDEGCSISTAFDEETLTFGSGELDFNGLWERPCGKCAAQYKRERPGALVWPP